jgi:penicillin V acylase-like amidase (Ntn superfamily)
MIVHKGENLPYPVLTNTIYSDAVQQVKSKNGNYRDNSVDRFATACNMVQQFKTSNVNMKSVDYAFNVLGRVAQGNATKWSIVYDITNRQIHFITNQHQQRKSFSFSDFDFNCKGPALHFNLNNKTAGTISKQFTPLSYQQNKAVIEKSANESKSEISIPPAMITGAADYFKSIGCK